MRTSKAQKKPEFLHSYLEFCYISLKQFEEQSPKPDWRIKEAILLAIGSLAEHMDGYKALRKMVEPMLQTFVLPELDSSIGLMKSRALWMYGEFGYIDIKNQEHISIVLEKITNSMTDENLAIKLQAAISLHKFIREKEVKNLLKPKLGLMLQTYLKIMDEIDSEELVAALEEMVEIFSDDIAPFAEGLCEELMKAYQRMVSADVDEDDGETALAAMGCVTAIRRILNSAQDNKELLARLEEKIFPIIMFSITPDGLDSIEDGLDCATILLYYKDKGKVSENFWKLFPLLVYLVAGKEGDDDSGYGFEFSAQVGVLMQNYISKDTARFMQPENFKLFTTLLQKTFDLSKNSEFPNDGIVACKMIISLFENVNEKAGFPNLLEPLYPDILQLLWSEL